MGEVQVVFGATGGAGGAVVRELVKRGKQVRAVSRSGRGSFPDGVERAQGDVKDKDDARRACRDAAVVYNCANVPYERWSADFPAIVRGSISGAAAAGAKLVFCDNLYMYGRPSGPMTEKTPRAATGKKGKLRTVLEHLLMEAHDQALVRVAIGRGSDFCGPNANSVTKNFVFGAVLKGKVARWPVTLDAPHTMTYLGDLARGLVTSGERDEALGEVWHLPSGPPVTGREFVTAVWSAANRAPKRGTLSRTRVRLGELFSPTVREVGESCLISSRSRSSWTPASSSGLSARRSHRYKRGSRSPQPTIGSKGPSALVMKGSVVCVTPGGVSVDSRTTRSRRVMKKALPSTKSSGRRQRPPAASGRSVDMSFSGRALKWGWT